MTNLPSRPSAPVRRHGRITQNHTSAAITTTHSPSKIRSANRFHAGIASGSSTGAGANSVSEVAHRNIAWATTTTSHTTPMAAHTVTAPLRTGVDATASDVRRSLLISTVAASPLATFFDE